MVKITTLMDNVGSEHLCLCNKHGLSFFIETPNIRILFDCGSDGTAISNAKRMNVPIRTADCVICSHSHYDHSGGFRDFVEYGIKSTLYTGKEFFEPKYAFDGVKYTYLGAGFDEEFLAKHQICHKECRDFLELSDGCYLFGEFMRTHSFETIPKRFVKGILPTCHMDDFSDEICLALSTSKGLVVIVGCSHPGILNMLETISKRLKKPIYAVLGGTHLVEADEKRVTFTISEMKKIGLKLLGLSHCSGELAQHEAMEDNEVQSCHLAVGDCFIVE
ncbi:MBL fold metallo-hydrolase [Clostridium fermenticellae]|uniref:MBL fold metallo-hydrolase n=1 Tax=Clostridium fermenticellae TaxID=2068654 RepID=A0A386H1H9_9CLOT|nr:MBL fold metallo-hydrolase [Clostridium fermenticellae]AYD39526.1 MBL fold metallo-hydrolase [Clostridium fermenticellae]